MTSFAYFLVIFRVFLFISAILHTQKGCASIRGPDDTKKQIGACFYWKCASIWEFRVMTIVYFWQSGEPTTSDRGWVEIISLRGLLGMFEATQWWRRWRKTWGRSWDIRPEWVQHWLRHAKRSLKSWVIVTPKEGSPIPLFVWQRPFGTVICGVSNVVFWKVGVIPKEGSAQPRAQSIRNFLHDAAHLIIPKLNPELNIPKLNLKLNTINNTFLGVENRGAKHQDGGGGLACCVCQWPCYTWEKACELLPL